MSTLKNSLATGDYFDLHAHRIGAPFMGVHVFHRATTPRHAPANNHRFFDSRSKLPLCLVCLLLLYWPLIEVRYYFLDDMGRALQGYSDYTGAGRPLVDILLGLMTLGPPLTDIAPAPQLLGVLSLALATVILARRFQIESPVSLGVFSIAMGASPYFLENMSFRFDSGFMALGVLCSITPFWLCRTDDRAPLAVSSVLLFASLCLYQPTSNCYPVIALYLMAQSLVSRSARYALAIGLRFAVPLFVAVLAYWSLWQMLPRWAPYLTAHGQFSPAGSAFNTAVENFSVYAGTIFQDWKGTGLGLIWPLTAIATCLIVTGRIILSQGRSLCARVATAVFAVVLLLLTFPAAFLAQIFLLRPELSSRTFVGFAALIAVFSASLLEVRRGIAGLLAQGLVILQGLYLLAVAYTYANALRMQERYDDLITSAIVKDVMELEPSGKIWTFIISGWAGRGPMVELALVKYPAFQRSIGSVIYQDSYWAAARFKSFNLWIKPYQGTQIDKLRIICSATPRKSNARYDLYLVEQTVFIRLKNDGLKC